MPKDIAFEEAVFLEPLACCINAQRFLQIGAGGIGSIRTLPARLEPIAKLIDIVTGGP
jgi:hypothetical protein